MADESSRPLSAADARQFAAHLAELAESGLPLPAGLRAMASEMPAGRLQAALLRTASELEAGVPLDTLVLRADSPLPEHVRGLVAAGVQSGRLAVVLERFLTFQQQMQQLRSTVSRAVAYPLLLLVLASLLLLFTATVLVPAFAAFHEELENFGTSEPLVSSSTYLLIWLSKGGMWWLVAAAGGVALALLLLWSVRQGRYLHRLLSGLPVVGRLWWYSACAECCYLLGVLLDESIPLPRALELTGRAIRDRDLGAGCDQAADQVREGQSLAASISGTRVFPPTLVPLVRWGERQGDLPSALETAGDYYARRAEMQGLLAQQVLPAIALLLILALALFIFRGLVSPLFTLMRMLSSF